MHFAAFDVADGMDRDDLIQLQYLRAMIGYWEDAANNPVITPFTISPEWLGDTRYMEAVTCSRAITQENP